MEKHCIVGQATDDKIIRCMFIAFWIPKATNTHSELCNTYCFSTATMAVRTRLNVTLYVHCLCFFCENTDKRMLTFSQYVSTYPTIFITKFNGVKTHLQKLKE